MEGKDKSRCASVFVQIVVIDAAFHVVLVVVFEAVVDLCSIAVVFAVVDLVVLVCVPSVSYLVDLSDVFCDVAFFLSCGFCFICFGK